ncbi:MAG: hypothetical protein ABIQ09_20750 [Jatrophihabitantaceae bacterium]
MAVIDQEPTATKTSVGKAIATAFRAAVREQLPPRSYRPRANLALDLCFTTTKPQSPQIENLAKHYLDQLKELTPGTAALLYHDDRQIKMLHVTRYHRPAASQDAHGQVALWCRPRTDAVNDLRDAADLRYFLNDNGGIDGDEHVYSPDDYWDEPEIFVQPPENGASTPVASERQELEEWYLAWRRSEWQRTVLRRNDASVEWLLQAYGASLITGSDPAEIRLNRLSLANAPWTLGPSDVRPGATDRAREALRTTLIQIPLPPLPDHGHSKQFKRQLDKAFQKFVGYWRGLIPITTPLAITILVVQPQSRSERDNVTHDLDNVARQVLPHVRTHLTQQLNHGDLITRYQVVELARAKQNDFSGLLTVVLGDGDLGSESSWMRSHHWIGRNLDRQRRY